MKKIIFVTGTRADYGKTKSLVKSLQKNKKFKIFVFVTGMHNLKKFGSTWDALKKDKIKNMYKFRNQKIADRMDVILSKTIVGFSKYANKINPDLIIIHGDRVETLACATVGSLNNFRTAHIEGGEVSGTVDEILRHSISKLCHIHFVSNSKAKTRLIQMGELKENIYIIGSPDVDILLSKTLPSLQSVKKKYQIGYDKYAISIFHPVTTELNKISENCKVFLNSIKESEMNYILIYPNNDAGSDIIFKEYKKLKNKNIKILPSMRFEYYLTLLKNCYFIIGNTSSGIIEAPYYGVPTINLGMRQNKRAHLESIINCNFSKKTIAKKIFKFSKKKIRFKKSKYFGKGNSFKNFINILSKKKIWETNIQKYFKDLKIN